MPMKVGPVVQGAFETCKHGPLCATISTMPTSETKGRVDADSSRHWFATTHWSVVLAAKQSDSPQAAAALENLYWAYRRPVNCDD